jgi:integrase
MRLNLPFLVEDPDRHGNVRLYVRKKVDGKFKKERIRSHPGSTIFMAEYQAALERLKAGNHHSKAPTIRQGTLGFLIEEYKKHAHSFVRLDARQQRNIHLIFESMLREETKPGSGLMFKDCPLGSFQPLHVKLLRDRKSKAPSQANRRVMYLRMAFDWAIEAREGCVNTNPAAGVKDIKYKKTKFHTWTREEVRQFEQRWPIGTVPRLAMAILAFTGTRRSDAVRLGPPLVKDGWVTFTPSKTRNSTGNVLNLPILKDLQVVLDGSTLGDKTWLLTRKRTPFKEASFGNEFREWCDAAGLVHCTAHGLRRAGATFAAEGGATLPQLMAIFGWATAQMAIEYIKAAEQKKLAGASMHLVVGNAS